MEPEFRQKIEAMEKQMAEVYALSQRLYKLIYWTIVGTIIATVLFFVIPLIGLAIEIPNFLNTYSNIGTIGSQ
jgi:hypothetical protein